MAKDKTPKVEETNEAGEGKQINVVAQYIKDLSFESPNAPASLQPNAERPNIGVSVDIGAAPLGTDSYEVELKIGVTAKRKDETLFLTEVKYGGVFILKNIPANELQPALLIFAPNMLFPYVRRIISDLTRDGGFPTLMLDPIDFGSLYIQRMQQGAQAQ